MEIDDKFRIPLMLAIGHRKKFLKEAIEIARKGHINLAEYIFSEELRDLTELEKSL